MASSSKQTRKSKSIFAQDRYVAELSTTQLVTGMCILLVFGLGCFLFGVLIGRVDPTIGSQLASNSPAASNPPLENVQTVIRPATEYQAPTPPPELRIPKQTATEKPVEPEPAKPPEIVVEPNIKPAETATTQSEELAKPVVNPAPTQVATATPPPEVAKPAQPRQAPPTSQPVTPKPATAPSKPLAGHYGIQIGAFGTSERADRAKKDLESKSKYQARVIPASNGQLFKVIVGDFSDQGTADRAKDDLRKNYGYEGAFPVPFE